MVVREGEEWQLLDPGCVLVSERGDLVKLREDNRTTGPFDMLA